MSRLRIALLAVVSLAAVDPCHAQEQEPNYNTQDNANLIENWLRSADPKQVAFGARFTADSDNEGEISTLLELAAQWNPSLKYPDQEHRLAMSEILHALIVRKVDVPASTLSAVAVFFPDQAAVLASRFRWKMLHRCCRSGMRAGET